MSDYAQQVDQSYGQAKLSPGGQAMGLGSVKPCPPPSPAVSLLDSLRLSQNETHSLIGDLESRLAFVLNQPAPNKEGLAGANGGVMSDSPLCSELYVRIDVEANIQARLRAILNGLAI